MPGDGYFPPGYFPDGYWPDGYWPEVLEKFYYHSRSTIWPHINITSKAKPDKDILSHIWNNIKATIKIRQ